LATKADRQGAIVKMNSSPARHARDRADYEQTAQTTTHYCLRKNTGFEALESAAE
jgi:hypothetical protein